MTPDLQRANDAANLACHGMSDRHVVSITASDALELLAVAGPHSDALRKAVGTRTGSRRVWLKAGELRSAITERRAA